MKCNEASEILAAAVLGDLETVRRRELHAHLAGCERCLGEEAELLETMLLLQRHTEEERVGAVHDGVMSRVAVARTRPMGRVTLSLLTAAATVLLVVGLQTVFDFRSPARPIPAPVTARNAAASESGTTLLRGTLFDRRRNDPEEIRRIREQRQGVTAPRPLDL